MCSTGILALRSRFICPIRLSVMRKKSPPICPGYLPIILLFDFLHNFISTFFLFEFTNQLCLRKILFITLLNLSVEKTNDPIGS